MSNTCKDCLHYRACIFHIDEETGISVDGCTIGFKNKDEYVKLPAYIGQSVWLVRTRWDNIVEIEEGKVSMIQQKADKSWKLRITVNHSVADYTLDKVGNHIFFSEAEAIEEHDRRVMELNA